MEVVKKMWGELLEQVCMFIFLFTKRQDFEYHIKLLLLLIFCTAVVDCRHDGTNLFSHYSKNVGNYVLHVERLMKGSWEAETSVENKEAVDPRY
jgi:hypothetical protein